MFDVTGTELRAVCSEVTAVIEADVSDLGAVAPQCLPGEEMGCCSSRGLNRLGVLEAPIGDAVDAGRAA